MQKYDVLGRYVEPEGFQTGFQGHKQLVFIRDS